MRKFNVGDKVLIEKPPAKWCSKTGSSLLGEVVGTLYSTYARRTMYFVKMINAPIICDSKQQPREVFWSYELKHK